MIVHLLSVVDIPDHLRVDVALPDHDVLQGERLHPGQLQVCEVRGLAVCPQNHFQNSVMLGFLKYR